MEHKMKNPRVITFAVASLLALSFLMGGCAREISRTKTTTVSSDGTVRSKEKTITESPDGTVTKKEEIKKTAPP